MDYLESLVTNSILPLYLNLGTLIGDEVKKGKESPQFTHTFMQNEQIQSSYMAHVDPIIFNFAAKTEVLREKKISRCKLNLNYKDTSFAADEFYPVHKDVGEQTKGITAIYYVNDCDGDTLFFNNNNEVIKVVTPKKGRIVYFDNQILHAGQPPKKSMHRILINFNWV